MKWGCFFKIISIGCLFLSIGMAKAYAAGDPPTISGTPPTTVAQGSPYTFAPTASDPDGETLLWAINNEPSWLSIDSGSGYVSGTPGSGDVGTTTNIVISVTDGDFVRSLPAFDLTVTNVNDPPIISGMPGTQIVQDNAYSFTPTASDADGDTLTFSIANTPSWASFNTSTGALTGTPSNADIGITTNISISVSDGTVTASLPIFSIEVTNANDPPTISGTPSSSVLQDNAYTFSPSASDPDGDTLLWAINNEPSWLSINSGTGYVSGTPGNGDVGTTSNIVISVTDGEYVSSLPPLSLTVVNVNDAPTINGTPNTMVVQDTAYNFTPSASDPDGDPLTFSIANKPGWASFNTSTGALTGTPTNAFVGTTTGIAISVSDGILTASLPSFSIEVTNANDPPTISGTPATSVPQNALYSFSPSASDPDGDTLTFSADNLPSWLSINSSSGVLSGTPGSGDVYTSNGILVSVTDGVYVSSLPSFNLTVTNVNDSPVISGTPSTMVVQDQDYSFIPTASDVDGDTLTFSVTGNPSWLSIDTSTGVLTGTPTNADVGTTTGIVLSVSDGALSASLPAFNLEVTNANDPPVISGTPATTVAQDSLYQFTPTASDPDGDTLTFSVVNHPSWLSIDSATGDLSGTPGSGDVAVSNGIVVSVTDGANTTSLTPFTLTVTNVNDAPVISGTPATSVTQDDNYNFAPSAFDADGDTLVFSISNPPIWASFNTSTGVLYGTPSNANVGTTTGIEITVSDGALTDSLPLFNIQVVDTNESPVISGLPDTSVPQDTPYSFTPTTSDPEGDTLMFSIVNKPSWANFSTTTGTLSGTPALADVGTTSGIVISVTDGQYSVSLAPFDLLVVGAAAPVAYISTDPAVIRLYDSAILSWDSTNVDTMTIDQGIGSVGLSGTQSVSPTTSTIYTVSATGQGGDTSASVLVDVAYKAIDSTFDTDEENFNYYDDTFSSLPNPDYASGSYASGTLRVDLGDGNTAGECSGGWLNYFYINADNTTVNVSLAYQLITDPGVAGTEYGRAMLYVDGIAYGGDTGTSLVHISGGSMDTGLRTASFDILLNKGIHSIIAGAYSAGIAGAAGIQVLLDDIRVNSLPEFTTSPLTGAVEDELYTYRPVVKEDDGDTLTFSLTGAPAGMSFDTTTGDIDWTPGNGVTTSGPLVLTVNDGNGGEDTQSFTITVGAVNDPPTISGTPPVSIGQDEFYDFTPTASDIDGDTLTFVVTNKPSWLSFEPTTGRLYGTPTSADIGVYPGIEITVDDNVYFVSLPAFDLTVVNVNDAPLISGSPATMVLQNENYYFAPTASDPDAGTTLTFTIANQPAWATFDPITGALYGEPLNEHVGTTSGIVISVSDGTLTTSLPAFDLTVAQVNDPPVISGYPTTRIIKRNPYSFAPTASDPDGDVLVFSATNLPAWLTLDTATGVISGTPDDPDVGVHAGIVLTVSDGLVTASLDPFDITVVNQVPVAVNAEIYLLEDATYNGTLTATDADNDQLFYSVVTPARMGTVTITDINAGTFTYTGSPDVHGNDLFTFVATDGIDASNVGTVFVTIESVDDPPKILSTAPTTVYAGFDYHYQPKVREVDGDVQVWSLTLTNQSGTLPQRMTIDAATGTVNWMLTDERFFDIDTDTTGSLTLTVSDGMLEASETFELTVVDPPDTNTTIVAVNAGGAEYTSKGGTTYMTDANYSGGDIWDEGHIQVVRTRDDELYQTTRYSTGTFSYDLPVPGGNYYVTLKMAELFHETVGAQTFTVSSGGSVLVSDLDLFAEVGKTVAYSKTFNVASSGGRINLQFQGTTNDAIVGAIRVSEYSGDSCPDDPFKDEPGICGCDMTEDCLNQTLTVDNGNGDGRYDPGTVVPIIAGKPPAGQVFAYWELTAGSPVIADVNLWSTTLVMPATDATVTAIYGPPTMKLTVNNGSGSNYYDSGEVVTITAASPPEGQVFDTWLVDTGSPIFADVNSPDTTLTMPAEEVKITATFKAATP